MSEIQLKQYGDPSTVVFDVVSIEKPTTVAKGNVLIQMDTVAIDPADVFR